MDMVISALLIMQNFITGCISISKGHVFIAGRGTCYLFFDMLWREWNTCCIMSVDTKPLKFDVIRILFAILYYRYSKISIIWISLNYISFIFYLLSWYFVGAVFFSFYFFNLFGISLGTFLRHSQKGDTSTVMPSGAEKVFDEDEEDDIDDDMNQFLEHHNIDGSYGEQNCCSGVRWCLPPTFIS